LQQLAGTVIAEVEIVDFNHIFGICEGHDRRSDGSETTKGGILNYIFALHHAASTACRFNKLLKRNVLYDMIADLSSQNTHRMPEPVIRFTKVDKRFGQSQVLRGVEFEIARGEFFGLAGVNGAGKTTLIKCLLDFCALDGGEISLFGTPHRQPAARSRLAFLPERFNPPYYLTGREFLHYALSLHRQPWNEDRLTDMVGRLGLDDAALARPVRSYSKGMTQKLGLAACFLSERDLYILDEPLSGLDPSARIRVKNLLAQLKTEGRTLFFTSHALHDIEDICDHMAILHQGSPRFHGPPKMLAETYGETSIERAFLRCIEDA
jgi:ABC-2 type transport system ATP-binding protein